MGATRRNAVILATNHGNDNDLCHSGFRAEDVGAFVGGGTGGEDIVDEEDRCIRETLALSPTARQGEGATEIRESPGAIQIGLSPGVASAAEDIGHPEIETFSSGIPTKHPRQLGRLVVLALAETPPMQGHRHHEPGVSRAEGGLEPVVLACLPQHPTQRSAEVMLALVFEPVDQLAAQSLVAIGADGEIERDVEIMTVSAAQSARHLCLVDLAADSAIGRVNAMEAALAGLAEPALAGGIERRFTGDTVSRVDQPEESLENVSAAWGDHA